jgi:hypothetical protein
MDAIEARFGETAAVSIAEAFSRQALDPDAIRKLYVALAPVLPERDLDELCFWCTFDSWVAHIATSPLVLRDLILGQLPCVGSAALDPARAYIPEGVASALKTYQFTPQEQLTGTMVSAVWLGFCWVIDYYEAPGASAMKAEIRRESGPQPETYGPQ